jgi:UDP-GlcNAc:undecaprenyl-phosphate/decaprenyl-phosphate GlcNAc-1-phosphate transferase
MTFFSTLLFSMFSTMALIPILRRYAERIKCVDDPGERKVHDGAMPKVGGLAMAVGVMVPMLMWASGDRVASAILSGSAVIVLFGFMDDVLELGYRSKFCAQLAAALVAVLIGGVKVYSLGSLLPDGYQLPDWMAWPLTVIVIVGVTNAINLSDGLDGLAGGIMLLCFICIGFIAYRGGNQVIALLAVAVGGAIFGFLRYNTYPATVFMGDAGSQLLGFLAVTMALTISQGSTPVSPSFPVLLLGLPILDTLMVMAERVLKGVSPFLADKNHLHHKLLRLNFCHSEAVFILYVLQAMLVTAAYILRFYSDWLVLLVFLGFALGVLSLVITADRNRWRINRPVFFLERLVKQRLKIHIKDRYMVVKVSQTIIETGFPLLLIMACVLPSNIPLPLSLVGSGIILTIMLARLFNPSQESNMLRLTIYLFLPVVVYYGDQRPPAWMPPEMKYWVALCFGALVFFSVVTLKATRRRQGFRATPMDFILLFVAMVVPNLPDVVTHEFNFRFMAAKIIVFFFVFEVLMGELRGQQKRLNLATVFGLLVVVGRGIVGGL